MQIDINNKRYEILDKGNKLEANLIKELDASDKLPEIQIENHKIFKFLDEYGKERIGVEKQEAGSYIILVLNIIFLSIFFWFSVKTIIILLR